MKSLMLWAVLAGAAWSGEVADGLYREAEEAGAPVVGKFAVGERQDLAVQEARVESLDNQNSRFAVSLRVPLARASKDGWLLLVARGRAWRQSSGGSDETASYLGFVVDGRADADAVAEAYKAQVFLRAHPGFRLATTFVPSRKEFVAGDAKRVTLRIENEGEASVFFQVGGRNRAGRDNQFMFRASRAGKPLPDAGSDDHFGGLSTVRELRPGEVFELEVNLEDWVAVDVAGDYQVFGAYRLEFFAGRDARQVAWEDWAAAEFVVRLKDKAK